MKTKIFTGVMLVIVIAIVAVFASSVSASPTESPLYVDPTPTPVIAYFYGSAHDITAVGNGYHEPPAGAHFTDYEPDGKIDLIVPNPSTQESSGYLVTLNTDTYSGDSFIQYGTNTGWMRQASTNGADPVMSVGNTYCCGTTDACNFAGYAVDSECGWNANDQDHAGSDFKWWKSFRTSNTVGDGGTVAYTIQGIYYGLWDCDPIPPDEREFISSGLLHGDDEVGESFQLQAGAEYMLMTNEGPWNDGTDDRYDVAVRFRSSPHIDPPEGTWSEWVTLDAVPGQQDVCDDSFLDANGAVLAFTTAGLEDEDYLTQARIQFRVNDTEGDFEDNSGDVEYYFLGGEGSSQGCGENWTAGSKVAGETLPAELDYMYDLSHYYSGGKYDGLVGPGESYLYKVTGSYQDNGAPSIDTIVYAGASGTPWTDPNDAFLASDDQCEDETPEGISYYGTTVNNWDPGLWGIPGHRPYGKINDGNANYGDNTGSVVVEWYEGIWTAPASDCSTKYTIGTFIESPVIQAKNSDGVQYPIQSNGLVIGQVYYLESQGTPFMLNGTPSYDFEIKNPAIYDDWTDPEAFFDCITPIDQERYGYYWTADAETFWLRAEFGILGHDENEGSIKFNFHGAIPNEVPDDEDCSDYYTLGRVAWRGSVDADSTAGYSIDHSVFTPGDRYAIAVAPGAYTDPDGTGKTGEIRRSAPGMGSVSYESMEDWGGSLCYESDVSSYDVVYFEAETLSDYEVRATEPDGGNTGTFNFIVYELDQIKEPLLGCENNYNDIDAWYVVKQNDRINANNPGVETDSNDNVVAVTGYLMANDFTEEERTFKIETGYLDPNNILPPNWDLQISYDGGATWVFLQDWVECWVDLDTPEGRGYFTSPVDGGPFILRVYDVGGVYLDNVGGVSFSMWVDNVSADPGDVWADLDNPQAWGSGCYAKCPRPGFLQVGAMVEYLRCRITRYFAWCPWHSEALTDVQNAFMDVEPFRTMFELLDLGKMVRAEVDSYTWTDEGGGGQPSTDGLVTAPPNFIFMPGEGGGGGIDQNAITGPDSIWGTGEIDLTPDDTISYKTECDTELTESVGTRLGLPMCFAFNVLDQLGMRWWFQMFWDFFMFVALVMYIKKNWVDKLQ